MRPSKILIKKKHKRFLTKVLEEKIKQDFNVFVVLESPVNSNTCKPYFVPVPGKVSSFKKAEAYLRSMYEMYEEKKKRHPASNLNTPRVVTRSVSMSSTTAKTAEQPSSGNNQSASASSSSVNNGGQRKKSQPRTPFARRTSKLAVKKLKRVLMLEPVAEEAFWQRFGCMDLTPERTEENADTVVKDKTIDENNLGRDDGDDTKVSEDLENCNPENKNISKTSRVSSTSPLADCDNLTIEVLNLKTNTSDTKSEREISMPKQTDDSIIIIDEKKSEVVAKKKHRKKKSKSSPSAGEDACVIEILDAETDHGIVEGTKRKRENSITILEEEDGKATDGGKHSKTDLGKDDLDDSIEYIGSVCKAPSTSNRGISASRTSCDSPPKKKPRTGMLATEMSTCVGEQKEREQATAVPKKEGIILPKSESDIVLLSPGEFLSMNAKSTESKVVEKGVKKWGEAPDFIPLPQTCQDGQFLSKAERRLQNRVGFCNGPSKKKKKKPKCRRLVREDAIIPPVQFRLTQSGFQPAVIQGNIERVPVVGNNVCVPLEQAQLKHQAFQPAVTQGSTQRIPVLGDNMYAPAIKAELPRQGLRPVVIDGSNVAMSHGNQSFSVKGITICVNYFLASGHKVVVFLPQYTRAKVSPDDRKILDDLQKREILSFTPSRTVQGKTIASYDDRFIVQYAASCGGVIVSRDNYRDLLNENPTWTDTIENRLLMFTWVGDMLMFPIDPLGRSGPKLQDFLSFS